MGKQEAGKTMADNLELKKIFANGTELHYQEAGSGEPVIFVHGSLGDYRTWAPQVGPFSAAYRTISYSRRYHYPNTWTGTGRDYNPDLHANDLIGMIEALNIHSVSVIGNSFGAYTTLVAAIRRPDLIKKAVLGEPPMLTWLEQIPAGKPYLEEFLSKTWNPAKEVFQMGNLEQGVAKFIDGVSGPGSWEHLPGPVKEHMLQNAPSLRAETTADDYFTIVTPEQVKSVAPKVLLVKGEHSPRMFHLVVDRLEECMEGRPSITIPNASHSIPSGNPAAYNDAVLRFFQEP